jgi:hypothetical protein
MVERGCILISGVRYGGSFVSGAASSFNGSFIVGQGVESVNTDGIYLLRLPLMI